MPRAREEIKRNTMPREDSHGQVDPPIFAEKFLSKRELKKLVFFWSAL